MIKAIIGKKEFKFNTSELDEWAKINDIVKLNDKEYHLILDNRSILVNIVKFNAEEKALTSKH